MNISTARRLGLAGPEVANERHAEGLRWFHVTVLSNFARGYDRYARAYRKGMIPESTYPGESYVLAERDLDIGRSKARRLKAKLAIAGDQIVAIEALYLPAASRRTGATGSAPCGRPRTFRYFVCTGSSTATASSP